MKRWLWRMLIGLLCALPMALLSFALAGAKGPGRVQSQPALTSQGQPDCEVCHKEFVAAWKDGAHGKATTDPTFEKAWQAQGSSPECLTCHTTGYDPVTNTYQSEGVTCEACHGPIPANHPIDPMPADRSAKLCGTCHTETFFEWQASTHRQVDVACTSCHDPHATQLKAEDSEALCAACHRARASNFAHSAHSQVGLKCADCHLASLDGAQGEGHALRDHSFVVRLDTCNSCHAYQMHDPQQVHPEGATPTPDAMAAVDELKVSGDPSPVSPVGFATLSALIGFASGIVMAPWLERWYRRIRREED
jgi:predicted CXXCH cytochrome family protein